MEERSHGRSLPPSSILIALVVVALLAGAASGAAVSVLLSDDDGDDSAAAASPSPAGVAAGGDYDAEVAGVVEAAKPSVVTIVGELTPRQDQQGRTIERLATGSGFIVDEAGYIVTNEHVVHEAANLTVVLSNGEERPAEVVSQDAPFTDLAVVKIPSGGLQALRIGDSARLRPGQTVVAIGTALFEYRNSVTVGVVSGLERRWLREGVYMEDLIQTDAALNSGNSGGPLITLDGAVVGINSTVIRTIGSDTVLGVAFAVSSRTFQPIVATIIKDGSYPRPYFGIDQLNVEEAVQAGIDPGVDRGALVQRVFAQSPAAAAGIETGDVILRIGAGEISKDLTFINALGAVGVNDQVEVDVWRAGSVFTTTVEVTPRE